jgi:hypothetical protein
VNPQPFLSTPERVSHQPSVTPETVQEEEEESMLLLLQNAQPFFTPERVQQPFATPERAMPLPQEDQENDALWTMHSSDSDLILAWNLYRGVYFSNHFVLELQSYRLLSGTNQY